MKYLIVNKNHICSFFLFSTFFSGCTSIIEKNLVPLDNVLNQTKTMYFDTSHSVDESYENILNNIANTKSNIYESKVVKFFTSDRQIAENREKNFVQWDSSSKYNSTRIIRRYLRKNNIKLREKELMISDKMEILKDYFFDKLKKEYLYEFQMKNKKVKFDSFLTDRENIEKIYAYKTALTQWEHQWNIDIYKTQKKVSELILSTLFGKQRLKFVSYNPYEEELFLSIKSQKEDFDQKIKIDVNKNIARDIKKNIRYTKSSIFYQLNENKLELVGVSIYRKKEIYLGEFTNTTYFRQRGITISTDTLDLKDEDVQYTEIIQNITPPSWYYEIKDKNVGYGQGLNQKDAQSDAYKNIAQSIKVVVNSNFTSEKQISGSILTKSLKSNLNIKSNEITIKKSEVLKLEKKEGIWFIAIKY
jgi:hypothetical protein